MDKKNKLSLPVDVINIIVSYSGEICRKCKEEICEENGYLSHYEYEDLEKKPNYEYKIPEKKPYDSDYDSEDEEMEIFKINRHNYYTVNIKNCGDCFYKFTHNYYACDARIIYGNHHASKKEIHKILYKL